MEQWAHGNFQATSAEETHGANLQALGQINCYNTIADIDANQLNEALKEDE